MSLSLRSPQTSSLTDRMIFLFFSVSAVSLAMLSWAMMGSQDLIGMQELSRGQLEMESRNELQVTPPSWSHPAMNEMATGQSVRVND